MHSWVTSFVWIVTFLDIGSPLNSIPKNRLVKEAGATFQLICNTEAGFEGPINWTHANSEDETDLDHQSHKLEIPDFEDSSAGNYSCWSGDKLLDSVHVFLAATPDSTTPKLRCWAETYNCSFKCSWSDPNYTAARLRKRDAEWVSLSSEGVCSVAHSFGSEEKVDVTLEAINDRKYLQIKESFYLHEIIQPPAPRCRVLKKGDDLEVEVLPADSWSKPTSYYPLEYQIEYEKRDDGQKVLQPCCKGNTEDCWSVSSVKCQVHARVSKFRIRPRDPLVHSDWESGQWTSWHNVGKKGKRKQNKGGKRRNGQGKKRKGKKGGEKRRGGKHNSSPMSS